MSILKLTEFEESSAPSVTTTYIKGEFWAKVQEKGFSHYYISHKGNLWNSRTERYAAKSKDKGGYYPTVLSNCKKKFSTSVHRLVASTFLANPENKPEVNHKDGNPANNHIDNLEWVTGEENRKHAQETGLLGRKTRENLEKRKEEIIKLAADRHSYEEIYKRVGCTEETLRNFMKLNNIQKQKTRKITNSQLMKIKKEFTEGVSIEELGKKHSYSTNMIRDRLIEEYGTANRITLQIEEVYKLFEQGWSYTSLAKRYGCSPHIIKNNLIRSYGEDKIDEARKSRVSKHYSAN